MKKYKIIILILSAAVIAQALLITRLWLMRPKKIYKAPPVAALKGKIAVVIDDWGYNLNNLAVLEEIKYPLTLAVLPNLPYTQTVSRKAHNLGLEVILHLPLEPSEKIRLERNTVMVSMDEKTIRGIVSDDLKSVAYAKGVSNHMGSSATKDTRTMSAVFSELKKRGLYFLDSYVSGDSVCFAASRKMKIGFAARDVFLDNTEDAQYIRGQVYELKARARARGFAIGIGHDRRVTLQVLKEVMPELEKEGYKFVFVSQLVK